MVNVGLSAGSILGLINICLGTFYCIASIRQKSKSSVSSTNRIFNLIAVPLGLILSGVILFFNGWTLDPVLTAQQYLMTFLVIYFLLVDLGKLR